MKTLVHIFLHTLVIFLKVRDPGVELLWNLQRCFEKDIQLGKSKF